MSKVKLDERLIAVTHPEALKSSVVSGKNFRITVLTDRLFRVETSVTGKFIDDATQSVWFRNLETPKYKAENTENTVKITTDAVTLVFDKKSEKSKIVTKSGAVIPATNKGNLKGTMRTLDGNFGIYFFKLGIMSKTGVAVFQDKGLILNKDGEVEASVFDRYRNPLYKEASYKPYIIAAMIMMSKVKDPVAALMALDQGGKRKIF